MPKQSTSGPSSKRARTGASPPLAPERTEEVESAKAAGLVYVRDSDPGIRRRRAGKSFSYVDAHGARVREAAKLDRIRMLAIPPAYEDVWICSNPRGHLQATGRDARGRKQYIYHPQWHAVRNETKFHRMAEFGHALPSIRRRVARDLRLPGLPRETVVAAGLGMRGHTQILCGTTK